MTVKELKKLLKGLPDDMDVVMEGPDDTFITVCRENSELETITMMDEEDDDEFDIDLLILRPCTCSGELMPTPESEINLN